jgi:hypothetical protein
MTIAAPTLPVEGSNLVEESIPPSPNPELLRRLYNDTNVNKAVFDYFAARLNNSAETTVDRLHAVIRAQLPDVSRRDIIELFKVLQRRGCGEFVTGRKGYPSRFVWSVELIAVGKAAGGEPTEIEPLTDADRRPGQTDENEATLIVHPYTLRPDLRIELALPRDLTAIEAGRIADFVRTLPFAK